MRDYTDPVSWWEYVQRIAKGASTTQIAEKMGGGLAASTIARWKKSTPHADTVKAFADAYNRPQREALDAAYLDEAARASGLGAASDKDLLAEVFKRMQR